MAEKYYYKGRWVTHKEREESDRWERHDERERVARCKRLYGHDPKHPPIPWPTFG